MNKAEPTSAICRAMHGKSRFAVPPVPTDLLPEILKRPIEDAAPRCTDISTAPDMTPQAPAPAARPSVLSAPNRHQPDKVYAVDRQRLVAAGMIRSSGGTSAQIEEFRIIKRRLLGAMADNLADNAAHASAEIGSARAQRIMVTSPHAFEGKSFCALGLALSIAAEHDREVLLVDGDLAQSSILNLLGLPAGAGLIDAIAHENIDVLDSIMSTDIARLSVLPGGISTASDSEYLSSARAAQVLDRLTQDAPNRIVIFDTPPVLAAAIPVELAKLVAQVVLVVRADVTSQGALEDAISLLSPFTDAEPKIHLLLNGVHFSPSGRRFGSHHA